MDRREQQRRELERRSGMERRQRLRSAMLDLRNSRSFHERRSPERILRDNAFVGSWISTFAERRV